jgi:hypothetical protein
MYSTLKFRRTESVCPPFVCAKFLVWNVFDCMLMVNGVKETNRPRAEIANAIVYQPRLMSNQLQLLPPEDSGRPARSRLKQVADIHRRRSVKVGKLAFIAVTHSTFAAIPGWPLSATARAHLHTHTGRLLPPRPSARVGILH